MKIGVPREIKPQEYRVGLTPNSVREYVLAGHRVFVETNSGTGIGVNDASYQEMGATIVADAGELFAIADMIVKVKEPQPMECELLRRGQILFTYLHLAPNLELTKALLDRDCVAIAYETVSDSGGGLPLLAPMSEVAGRLSIEAAAAALKSYSGGRGILLGGVPGVQAARVVVIGGGVVGTQAARVAVGMGAEVTILDNSLTRLRKLDDIFQGRVRTRFSSSLAIDEELCAADAVIGAVLVPGASAPKLVERSMLKSMRRGSVLVDVAIDQGGCFETSTPTTHANPTYDIDGIIHYCVANMPGAVPITSSYALNHATLPFGLSLAMRGIDALSSDTNLRHGLNIYRGSVTNQAVADSLGFQFVPPALALKGQSKSRK